MAGQDERRGAELEGPRPEVLSFHHAFLAELREDGENQIKLDPTQACRRTAPFGLAWFEKFRGLDTTQLLWVAFFCLSEL